MPEISSQMEKYLRETRIPLRLACLSDKGWPVVLSLWYLFDDGKIYCATQETALVIRYLKTHDRCAFEIAADMPPYCGARGQGRARVEPSLGPGVLKRLLERYAIDLRSSLAEDLLSRSDSEVAIVIEPASWHTWDFTKRMEDSLDHPATEKLCP